MLHACVQNLGNFASSSRIEVCNTYCGYQCIIYTEEDDTLFHFVRVSDCKNIPNWPPGIWNIFAVCRMENIYMEL